MGEFKIFLNSPINLWVKNHQNPLNETLYKKNGDSLPETIKIDQKLTQTDAYPLKIDITILIRTTIQA